MRFALLRIPIVITYFIFLSTHLAAQICFNTGLNGTVINLPCNQNCVNIPVRIPHLKGTAGYTLNSVPYNPFPFVNATGVALTSTYIDDKFSPLIDLPFGFCFYDSIYNKIVVGSNGVVTFDEICANQNNAYTLTVGGAPQPIPYNGSTVPTGIGTTYYPRASVMGAYHDIDPSPVSSAPPERRIEYNVIGTAPCRKFAISYYHVPMFGSTCNSLLCTQQIVLYESTGVVEVYFENKPVCPSWEGGRAILGIQNWARNAAVAAPGKNCTAWSETNTGYQFVPSAGVSRFVSCSVQTLSGTFIANGDTATTTPGLLDVTFPTFCPTGSGGQYVIKTTFSACENSANQLVSYDTITINKTNSLNATAATTQTACGASGSGTAVVAVPAGIGTAPYTFVLSPGGTTLTGNSPQQFTGLNAGSYNVVVTDAGGSCSTTVPITITSTGVLAVTYTTTNTTCYGATNGSIVVNPPNGTSPITYAITGGPITTPFTTNNTFSNLALGTYFISTHDNAGCQANDIPVTIIPGPPMGVTIVTTLTSCPGAANGTIMITGATGTAPYLYSIQGGPNQSANTFTGLVAGSYYIVVTDAVGCTTSNSITVNNGPGNVTGTATSTPPSCTGATNGTVTVTATSGSGPYQYSLNGGPYQSSNVFTGLAPGSYSIIIKEAGLCTSSPIPVTVNAGGALLANATSVATSCNGAADGTITVTPTNGSAPYQYSLDGGANQAGNTFNGVSSGPHNVIVRDGAGCVSAAIPVTVTAGPALTGTATSTATACTGVNNGTVTATATNGTGPYQYSLDGGAPHASNTFTGVSAGPHNVVIRNTAGCLSANIPVTVATGTALTATTSTTSTACVGINNGSITITPTNGSAPYQYSLDGGGYQASNSFTGVSAGSHNVVVKDNLGCISSAIPVTVAAGTVLTGTATSTGTTCNGASNGTITATATNGNGPYQYSLDGGANQSANVFTGVTSGPHNLVIRDNFGCISAAIPVVVVAGGALNATPSAISTTCSGASNGSITVTAPTNGTGPYQYSLNGGAPQLSATFTGLVAAAYTINVTDAGGCSSASLPVTVNAGPSISETLSKTDATCFGSATGSMTAIPSANATAPLQYSLNNVTWQASPNFSTLPAGTYTVYIRDAVGCSNSSNITVGQPSPLAATTSQQSVLCNSGNDGKIVIAATGGTAPYSYSLDNITFQSVNTFNVAAGIYTVYVKDANGCVIPPISNINVAQPAALTAVPATTNATCDGGNNGSINIIPAGGTSPYQYAITGGTFQPAGNFNVAPGAFDVTVKDVNGCSYQVTGIVVGLTNNLTYTPMTDPAPICESNSIQLQLATNATQFAWSNGGSLSSGTIANPVAKPSSTTLYAVTATLGRCTITDDVLVAIMPAPIPDAGPAGDICYGKAYQLQGSGGVTYRWTPSTYLSSASVYNPVVTPDKTITYSLNVKDANGCSSLVTAQVTVKVTPPIKVTVYPADTIVYGGVQIPLQATSAGTSYVWSNTTGTIGLNNPNIANPIATLPLADGSVVVYKVTATTSAGCQGEAHARIRVYKGPDLYMVTGFTPNGDGKNDVFVPFPVGIKQLNYFRVVNRWGQVVYSTKELNKGWDGRFGGVEQPASVYVWMVQGVAMDKTLITKKGTVTLIR